jgi:hypothetical protein
VFRSVLSVVIGLAIGVTIIGVVEAIGHRMYPPLVEIESAGKEAINAARKAAPPGAFIMVLVAWYLGTSTGAGVAAYMASRFRWRHGWIVAGILLLCGLIQMFWHWHPAWFRLVGLAIFPIAATVGMLIGTQPIPGKREGYVIEGPPNYSKEAEERMKMAGR